MSKLPKDLSRMSGIEIAFATAERHERASLIRVELENELEEDRELALREELTTLEAELAELGRSLESRPDPGRVRLQAIVDAHAALERAERRVDELASKLKRAKAEREEASAKVRKVIRSPIIQPDLFPDAGDEGAAA